MEPADLVRSYRLLVESSPDMLSRHTAGSNFVFASLACERLVGYTPEELTGRALDALVEAEDLDRFRRAWEQVLVDRQPVSVRYRLRRSDGRRIWVESVLRTEAEDTARPEQGERGSPAGAPYVVGLSRDVDAAVLAEQELRDRLARAEVAASHLDHLIAMVPGIVWYGPIRADLRLHHATYISDYLTDVLGYAPDEWLSTPGFWESIVHPDDRSLAIRRVGEALADGASGSLPYRVFAKDGRTVWLQSFLRIERDAEGTPTRLHGLTLDVTTFKEAELKCAHLLERAEALQRRLTRLADEERQRLQAEIERQAASIVELATPVIPLSHDVLVMPLIGTVDSARAAHFLESMLRALHASEARIVIVDVTGVPMLDDASADALVRAAQAAQLLGARVVLTGLRPVVATKLVELGVGLGDILTRGSLESAVAELVLSRRA